MRVIVWSMSVIVQKEHTQHRSPGSIEPDINHIFAADDDVQAPWWFYHIILHWATRGFVHARPDKLGAALLKRWKLKENKLKQIKVWPQTLKKTIITLQALRFKLNGLNQTCISLKSIMQLTKTIFPDSAIFIEKKRVEIRLWRKSEFLWRKINK